MSLVYVVFVYCMSFIGWIDILLAIMELFFHMYGIDFTTHGSNLKSLDPPGSLNCQCDLVSNSSPTMDPFAHGDTITLLFSSLYEFYSDILDPCDIRYKVMKVLHEIGNIIHGLIHNMKATQEAYYVDSFDAIWEIFCRDIFPIIDYAFISEYVCSKNNSYHQGASPHVICLQHIDALMHDHGIHNILTSISLRICSFNSFK